MSDNDLKPGPLDSLLDLAVAPGYTKIGYAIRSRDFEPLPDATGKQILITGASAGLGLAAAKMCAKAGASVTMVSRDRTRGERAVSEVKNVAASGASITFEACDMADLDAVRGLAEKLAKRFDRLDALVLNAGVLLSERTITADGIELAWATNVVGPRILQEGLVRPLTAAKGRIVVVTSGGAYTESLAMPEVDLEKGKYDGAAVYARTKRSQIAIAQVDGERLLPLGITVHVMHPGWADTPGVKSSLPTFRRITAPLLRSAEQGADTIAWLALAKEPNATTGELWHDRRIRPKSRRPAKPDTASEREALCDRIDELAGLSESAGTRS